MVWALIPRFRVITLTSDHKSLLAFKNQIMEIDVSKKFKMMNKIYYRFSRTYF